MLTTLQTALNFILILGVLVFFHELGHFGVAKFFKMRVEEFAFGFGKRLFRIAFDGQTEYNIRALPLGGFVRIAGMEIEDSVESRLTGGSGDAARYRAASGDSGRREIETTNTALLEQEAVEEDGAIPDGFNSRPVYQRFLVILAGPVFSFLLGWLVFCLLGAVWGFSNAKATNRIAEVKPGGIAAKAGLKAGDAITAVNSAPVTSGDALIDTIHASAGKTLRLLVQSPLAAPKGAPAPLPAREIVVTPEQGEIDGKPVGLINIVPELEAGGTYTRVGLRESFARGNQLTVSFFQQLGSIFKRGRVRESLGGPIAIFQATRQATKMGGPTPVFLMAQLSLSLAVFNLLPIPILDGGHLTLLSLEAVRRRKLTSEQTQRVLMAGLAVIALLFVFIMFNDITRLVLGRG